MKAKICVQKIDRWYTHFTKLFHRKTKLHAVITRPHPIQLYHIIKDFKSAKYIVLISLNDKISRNYFIMHIIFLNLYEADNIK